MTGALRKAWRQDPAVAVRVELCQALVFWLCLSGPDAEIPGQPGFIPWVPTRRPAHSSEAFPGGRIVLLAYCLRNSETVRHEAGHYTVPVHAQGD